MKAMINGIMRREEMNKENGDEKRIEEMEENIWRYDFNGYMNERE